MACRFCKINKEKNKIIKEGKYTFVILSNPRLMPGHLLVVPKRHVEKISELTKKEREELIETVIKFQEIILKKIAPGCDISQHYRPFLKESKTKVNHLHIHLLPRKLNDELYLKSIIHYKEIFKDLTKKEIKEISNILIEKQKKTGPH
jgi:histidine triad (HIT) family protein